jgi:hypothetical protein
MTRFRHTTLALSLITLFALSLISCGGSSSDSDNTTGGDKSVVTKSTPVSANATCPNGGVQVDSGIDENGNGVLDASEVDTTQFVCNGANGLNSLISVTAVTAGVNCTYGGYRIDVGLDIDSNGVLEASEVSSTVYICNNMAGSPSTPIANAGPDQSDIKTGSTVYLDASLSYDPDGYFLTYAWAITSKPVNSTATLSDPTAVNPFFTADMDGTYTFSLIVDDGITDSAPDSVTITAGSYNSPPVANAGSDQSVVAGETTTVTLDGSQSSDVDSDPLTYTWAIHTKPAGSNAVLSDTSAINPAFTADVEGSYVFTLVVNDGTVDSMPASVTVKAYRYIDRLDFRVIDAEYSKQLGRIVFVSTTPLNQLHIYDPVAEQDIAVNLPLAPSSVSVSPDGLYAAVGHNAYVSYVDLTTPSLVDTFPSTADVSDVVLAGNGYIYAFPRIDQWETIRCINIATGQETRSSGYSIRAGTKAKLHLSGTSIYGADNGLSPSDIEKYDISGGTAAVLYDSPYHGDYSMCGDLWMSEDGLRIFTRCGNVFRSSAVRAEDMTYNGSLEGLGLVRHLSHSAAIGNVIAVPDNSIWSNEFTDKEIQIFGYDYLTFKERIPLPHFIISGNGYAGRGRFVFYNSDGSKYFAVVQADGTSGLLYDYGVVTY